jgi:hypothetical protein
LILFVGSQQPKGCFVQEPSTIGVAATSVALKLGALTGGTFEEAGNPIAKERWLQQHLEIITARA